MQADMVLDKVLRRSVDRLAELMEWAGADTPFVEIVLGLTLVT